jgi:phosphopentomutase
VTGQETRVGSAEDVATLMQGRDLLVLCADHGCDPTWRGSDHTREHIPVLACGGGLRAGSLGRRETFADIGQTLAAYFSLPPMDHGTSFL